MMGSRGKAKAFTLLEILIAIAILAVGLVTIFSLFPIGIYAVRDTVEGTRGASLARTARATLSTMRADMRLMDSGSQHYPNHMPLGPWEYPSRLKVFRSPVREYVDLVVGVSTLHRQVVFDDRTMVGIQLRGTFNGTRQVTVDRTSVTRDADLLWYYLDTTGSEPYPMAPWDIFLRVGGALYRIDTVTYVGAPFGRDIGLIDIDSAWGSPSGGELPFEILLPVAVKEPPVDVPLEWVGGVADFDVSPAELWKSHETRNLHEYMLKLADGWISVDGDWCEVIDAAVAPSTIKLDGVEPAPTSAGLRFSLLLPVVRFDGGNVDPGLDLVSPSDDLLKLDRLRGGGAQLGFLESGAWIEVVVDGGVGDFDPVKADAAGDRRTVLNSVTNSNTAGFIIAGNFIRVNGRDWEIAEGLQDIDGVGGNDDFLLAGTVPALGTGVSFQLVLGYDAGVAGQTRVPARFPVMRVTRSPRRPPAALPFPVTSFYVGRDANGNLPTDIWPGGWPTDFYTPVKVLPANRTRFSYSVAINPKSPVGMFTLGSVNVDGPSWVQAADTNAIGAIPYPPALSHVRQTIPVIWANNNIFEVKTLTAPTAGGTPFPANLQDVQNSGSRLVLTGAGATWTSAWGLFVPQQPFHAIDANDLVNLPGPTNLPIGTGTYSAAGPPPFSISFDVAPTEDAIFLAPLQTVLLNGVQETIVTVDPSLDFFTIIPPMVAPANPVTIQLPATGLPRSYANGRGQFVEGSDAVTAVYPHELASFGGPGLPGAGFPYSRTAAKRYHLAVGDYIEAPDNNWYAVKAIQETADTDDPADATNDYDVIILDRIYEGATSASAAGDFFRYVTPVQEAYSAQVAVYRNYAIQPLYDENGARDVPAAFGLDTPDGGKALRVHLKVPAPPTVRPGDYIRADGDANHPDADLGLADAIDGDGRWYMIESIGPDDVSDANYRQEITLTSPYRGHIPSAATYQPASVTRSVIRTYDTVLGAF